MALSHLPDLDPTPDPRALQAFRAAQAALDAAIEKAAAAMVADEREALIDSLREGRLLPSRLVLTLAKTGPAWSLPGSPTSMDSSTPAEATGSGETTGYYEWKAATARLRQAGNVLRDYAELLGRFADPKALSPAEIALLEKKLDLLALSGLKAGEALDSAAERRTAAGLLSLAAADLFRLILRQKRGRSFQKAVAANDDAFRHHVESLQVFLEVLRACLRVHYANDTSDILAAWNDSVQPDPAAPPRKGKGRAKKSETQPAKRLVALNDSALERLEALAAIEEILAALPAIHAALKL
jgi:hypothetical protein